MKSKKLCSILLCSIIICSSSASVLACNSSNNRQAMPIEATNIKIYSENTFSSDFYYDELAKLGFTESEMYDLYLKESNKIGMRLMLPNKLSKNINKNFAYPTRSLALKNSYRSCNRSRGGFPSNPQIGQTYEITHTVSMADLAKAMGYPGNISNAMLTTDLVTKWICHKSKTEIAKALGEILGLGSIGMVLSLAGWILGEVAYKTGNYGIRWTQTWYYGEDNNMNIGWTPGYISHKQWIKC